jgi:hypothetical protein
MNKFYLKGNQSGRFFVTGQGFTARTVNEASKLTQAQVDAARTLGFEPSTAIPVSKSFAINYVRKEDLTGYGAVRQNNNNPSKRRFATFKEALHHGARHVEKEGHLGCYITESTDKVNAAVNWASGLTNPVE